MNDTAGAPVVVDLGAAETDGRDGVLWSLPHGGDLDANLVHLHPDHAIGEHVNGDVDVVMSVTAGSAELVIDGAAHSIRCGAFALVPRGTRRSVRAGADGVTYVSIHRRRDPLGVGPKPPGPA